MCENYTLINTEAVEKPRTTALVTVCLKSELKITERQFNQNKYLKID